MLHLPLLFSTFPRFGRRSSIWGRCRLLFLDSARMPWYQLGNLPHQLLSCIISGSKASSSKWEQSIHRNHPITKLYTLFKSVRLLLIVDTQACKIIFTSIFFLHYFIKQNSNLSNFQILQEWLHQETSQTWF